MTDEDLSELESELTQETASAGRRSSVCIYRRRGHQGVALPCCLGVGLPPPPLDG